MKLKDALIYYLTIRPKELIWNALSWIDNEICHNHLDNWFLNNYKFHRVLWNYCQWLHTDLDEKWFPEGEIR